MAVVEVEVDFYQIIAVLSYWVYVNAGHDDEDDEDDDHDQDNDDHAPPPAPLFSHIVLAIVILESYVSDCKPTTRITCVFCGKRYRYNSFSTASLDDYLSSYSSSAHVQEGSSLVGAFDKSFTYDNVFFE